MDMEVTQAPVSTAGMMLNAHGYWVPERLVRPETKLEDQTVKMLCGRAREMRGQLASFRFEAFADVDQFMEILAERYGAKPRSTGNTTLTSFDGLQKVEISTGHFLTLGPELQSAKSLIDECLEEWSEGANDNLKVLVNDAFAVGEGGKLRVDRILALRRVDIADAKWQRAMAAISDAIRVTHSKRYVRFHERTDANAPWKQIALDVARVP
jgi:hypothetical protein